MLAPDISSWLGYCFDISLLSLVCVLLSDADFGLNTLYFDISLLSLVCVLLSDADFGLNTLDFDISLLFLVSHADTIESEFEKSAQA